MFSKWQHKPEEMITSYNYPHIITSIVSTSPKW